MSSLDKDQFRRGRWTEEEDATLSAAVTCFLEKVGGIRHSLTLSSDGQYQRQKSNLNWIVISSSVPYRNFKQCRERWTNHLSPELSKDDWSSEEDAKLWKLVKQHPKQWALIAFNLPGRSQSQARVRWKSLSRARKRQQVRDNRNYFRYNTSSTKTTQALKCKEKRLIGYEARSYAENSLELFTGTFQADFEDYDIESSFEQSVLDLLLESS